MLALAFLFVPMTLLFGGYALLSDNIGVRYIVPVLPFTCLIAGAGLAALLGSRAVWMRAVGAVLCLWVIVAAAGIYPDHLSYFNEAACLLDAPSQIGLDGGSRCGPLWLDDSNVDWGQGLKQLKAWLDQHAAGQVVRLQYFGSFPPSGYGLRTVPMDNNDLLYGNRPGLYAVSSHIVAYTPAAALKSLGGGAAWPRQRRPVAIVGHAYYIFAVPEQTTIR